jgi:hypothetical protein
MIEQSNRLNCVVYIARLSRVIKLYPLHLYEVLSSVDQKSWQPFAFGSLNKLAVALLSYPKQ